jgi:microcin C transport system substrate-binding protein
VKADRRTVLAGSAALAAAGLLPGPAQAQSGFGPPRHGFSAFGELAYGPDTTHFAYVNPDAPKGGTVALQISRTQGNQAFDTFNTLNIYVLKGDATSVPGQVFCRSTGTSS